MGVPRDGELVTHGRAAARPTAAALLAPLRPLAPLPCTTALTMSSPRCAKRPGAKPQFAIACALTAKPTSAAANSAHTNTSAWR